MITAITSFQTYGLFFLRDSVGLDNPAEALGRMILVIAGTLAIAVYISGWASDRVGRKPVVMVGAIGAAISSLWMLTATDSANWALANEFADESQAGLHIGIVNLATITGAAVAKMLGPVIDGLNQIPGRSDGFGYQVLITTDAVFFLIGALLLLPLKTVEREKFAKNPDQPSG